MYVCLCTGVTEKTIREVLREGASTVEEVMYCTGAGTRCGSCAAGIAELVLEHEAAEGEQAKSTRHRLVVIRSVNSAA
jgi:bacterioferritin-associated ferredoxin